MNEYEDRRDDQARARSRLDDTMKRVSDMLNNPKAEYQEFSGGRPPGRLPPRASEIRSNGTVRDILNNEGNSSKQQLREVEGVPVEYERYAREEVYRGIVRSTIG